MSTDGILRDAYATHSEVLYSPWPGGKSSSHALGSVLQGLRDAIGELEALAGSPGPGTSARRKAERNVRDATGELRKLMPQPRGSEMEGIAA